MKVVHVSHSDRSGGAARAAVRIHHAVRGLGIDSTMLVANGAGTDPTIVRPSSAVARLWAKGRRFLALPVRGLLRTASPSLHSPAFVPSRRSAALNDRAIDLVHLHWVNCEMMSIADIGRLSRPVVWTLHDMWAFCGAEHYADDDRWRHGYTRESRPANERGFDLNRWTWLRKRRHWKRPLQIVAPCRWLADCVAQSPLLGRWPVTVIPHPLDTGYWRPEERRLARRELGLPAEAPLLLYGAVGGEQDPRKGFDLLAAAVGRLRELKMHRLADLELIVFGDSSGTCELAAGVRVRHVGHVHDDQRLRLLYAAADALAVPSRQEAFGLTAAEAQACGTPVVAFDTGGLADIVSHRETGYLARPFDSDDLAAGIAWVLSDAATIARLGAAARDRACRLHDANVVARQYVDLYERVVGRDGRLSPPGRD